MKRLLLLLIFTGVSFCHKELQFSTGRSFYDSENVDEANRAEIETLTRQLVRAIIAEKPDVIISQVDPKTGLFTDLKSFFPYDQLKKEISRSGSTGRAYWIGTGDIDPLAEILAKAGMIQIDFHFYNAIECEIYLKFGDRPPLGILSNPIYRKIGGHWRLVRLL